MGFQTGCLQGSGVASNAVMVVGAGHVPADEKDWRVTLFDQVGLQPTAAARQVLAELPYGSGRG